MGHDLDALITANRRNRGFPKLLESRPDWQTNIRALLVRQRELIEAGDLPAPLSASRMLVILKQTCADLKIKDGTLRRWLLEEFTEEFEALKNASHVE